MKKPSGKIKVSYRSGREEFIPFKTYEGKDYKEPIKDLNKSVKIGSTLKYEIIFNKVGS